MNLNDTVRVKLNDHGRQWLCSFYEQSFEDWPLTNRKEVIEGSLKAYEPREDGYVYLQLWVLIEIFGGTIRLGAQVPFESSELEVVKE